MATQTLPIHELERSVRIEAEKAHADTERVAACSKGKEDFRTFLQIIGETFALKRRFGQLTTLQGELIAALVECDFAPNKLEDLGCLASSIDELVVNRRDMLSDIDCLGSEIRICWKSSIRKISDQVEHLDSIAESLRAAADPECSALFSLAAEHVTAR